MALDADELQYERGYGPCVDAGRASQMFLVSNMRTRNIWLAWLRPARGVLSSLSVPMPFQGAAVGALNTYAGYPEAFGEQDVVLPKRLLPGSQSPLAMRKQQPARCASRPGASG